MNDIRTIGAIVVSAFALLTFAGSLIISFFFKDPGLLNLTVGAAIAMASMAVSYWVGSSSGSARKDDTMADIASKKP